jgi:uncharacterized DUF497 family protein
VFPESSKQALQCSLSTIPTKVKVNLTKHGIDFEAAKLLWQDQYRVELQATSAVEPRFLVIGKIKGKYWSAIITYRGTNVRIISVRRSRDNEVSLYER